MKHLLIDKQSASYKYGSNWLTRLCIKYLIYKGVIHTQEYTTLTFEHFHELGKNEGIRDAHKLIKTYMK